MVETNEQAGITADPEDFDPVRDTEELVRCTREFLDKCPNPSAYPRLISIVEEMERTLELFHRQDRDDQK